MKKQCFAFLIILFSFCSMAAQIPYKVILCGICKDIGNRVSYSMRIMEKIGRLFDDYRIIVYENNSSDATPRLVREWQSQNEKVFAITENISKADLDKMVINRSLKGDLFRIELIARARNIVLDQAMSEEYADFDYIIWMDMDFIIEPHYTAIVETFEREGEWDAVFAYGVDPYYRYWDWYALRDDKYPIGPDLLGRFWWIFSKQLILDPLGDWHRVYSAFGGCGIYKKDSIKGCRYSAFVTEDLAVCMERVIAQNRNRNWMIQKYFDDIRSMKNIITIGSPSLELSNIVDKETGIRISGNTQDIIWRMNSDAYKYPSVCEHVAFHASMIVRGHDKLFINPRLVFHYGEFVA